MNVIIAGSREFTDTEKIESVLRETNITKLICGMCRGPDKIAFDYCKKNKIEVEMMPALWEEYGRSAGPIRNKDMAKQADYLIAFWNGKSRGTKNMIEEMKKLNKPIKIVHV